jgi:hypothetical protein
MNPLMYSLVATRHIPQGSQGRGQETAVKRLAAYGLFSRSENQHPEDGRVEYNSGGRRERVNGTIGKTMLLLQEGPS